MRHVALQASTPTFRKVQAPNPTVLNGDSSHIVKKPKPTTEVIELDSSDEEEPPPRVSSHPTPQVPLKKNGVCFAKRVVKSNNYVNRTIFGTGDKGRQLFVTCVSVRGIFPG